MLENCSGAHHMKATFQTHLEGGTQLSEESLQDLAASIGYLTHCAHIELPVMKPPVDLAMGYDDRNSWEGKGEQKYSLRLSIRS
jgi:hypothetical protein